MNTPARAESAASGEDIGDDHLWNRVENASARRVLTGALESFAARGYHATTTRQISERAELSPTAMYAHFRSKMDLLVFISEIGHAAVLEEVDEAIARGTDLGEQVSEFVRAFSAWHARNHTLARVIQYELHAIPADRFESIRDLRRITDQRLRKLLQDGTAAGVFAIEDLNLATLSILSLGIDVARWYDGHQEPADLGDAQSELVMRMIAAS